MAVYFADDFALPAVSAPQSNSIRKDFVLTPKTALAAYGGAGGFLIHDFLALTVIPGGCVLEDFIIDVCPVDSGTTVTFDVGDNQILAGAVTGLLSTTAQTTPSTSNGSFTLTASASTASFAAAGMLMIGGVPITYTGLSGSTFTGCRCATPSFSIPAGALIQQAGNLAAYFAVASGPGQNAQGSIDARWGTITGTTVASATRVANALPAVYPQLLNTSGFNVAGNLGALIFGLTIHASPTGNPSFGTGSGQQLSGYIGYRMRGYAP